MGPPRSSAMRDLTRGSSEGSEKRGGSGFMASPRKVKARSRSLSLEPASLSLPLASLSLHRRNTWLRATTKRDRIESIDATCRQSSFRLNSTSNVFASPPVPFPLEPTHLARNSTLKSLALVHSSFRSEAQQLLAQEVWVDGTGKRNAVVAKGLDQKSFERAKVTHLTSSAVEDGRMVGPLGPWHMPMQCHLKNVESLSLDGNKHFQHLDNIVEFFPRLKVLEMSRLTSYYEFRGQPVFTELERLVLSDGVDFLTPQQRTSDAFRPKSMPRFRHLALDCITIRGVRFDSFLRPLFPRLTSVALSKIDFDRLPSNSAGIFVALAREATVLNHLSLQSGKGGLLAKLFRFAAGLELKTLHLSSTVLEDANPVEELAEIARGGPGPIKVEKVVIYELKSNATGGTGSQREQYRDLFHWVQVDNIEGVEGREAPFAEFDGSF